MSDAKPASRRRHDADLKRQITMDVPAGSAAFVPVSVVTEAPPCDPPQSSELELQRGPVHARVRWPMVAAASYAAWLREMLR